MAPSSLCAALAPRFACFDPLYKRFCDATAHEQWVSEDEFIKAWRVFVGHEKECTPDCLTAGPPVYIVEELIVGGILLLMYFICCVVEKINSCIGSRGSYSVLDNQPGTSGSRRMTI